MSKNKECEFCKKEHDCSYGSGRFCSESCARKHSSSMCRDVINEKISSSLRGRDYSNTRDIFEIKCPVCGCFFKKELHILAYKENRFVSLCEECKKKTDTLATESKIFKYWVGVMKQQKTIYEKKKKLPWNKIPKGFKKRIILEEQDDKCDICGISEWNGKKLRLNLHHKDGNNKNDERNNLQCICFNCHGQTDTFGIKSLIKNKPDMIGKKIVSDETLLKALLESKSINAALLSCGIDNKGHHHSRAKKLLENYFNNYRKVG